MKPAFPFFKIAFFLSVWCDIIILNAMILLTVSENRYN